MSDIFTLTKALAAWGVVLVAAYYLTLVCLPPLTADERSGLATLFGAIGLVPPAAYAYWPRPHE